MIELLKSRRTNALRMQRFSLIPLQVEPPFGGGTEVLHFASSAFVFTADAASTIE